METIPFPKFSCRDLELAIGLPKNTAHYYIATGQLEAVKGESGYRVTYDAAVRFVMRREAKKATRS